MTDTESGQTVSVWMSGAEMPAGAPLDHDINTDVCVIGAGIAGITTAYLLAREGRAVLVVDQDGIGGGQTGRTTAHLSNAIDDRYVEVERIHGEKGARLAAQSHTAAIGKIESIVADEAIDCGFARVDGYLFPGHGDSRDLLEKELKAAHRAGLGDVTLLDRTPFTTFEAGPCLRFPRQAQFHPLRYLAALARAIERDGGMLVTRTHVSRIEPGTVDGSRRVRVETQAGPVISAASVVVATNTPINERIALHAKQAPYRTYAIAGRLRRGVVPAGLFWDTEDPYHYIRLLDAAPEAAGRAADQDWLIVGGEDHKTGQADHPEDRHGLLEAWTASRFPLESVDYRWSGQVWETPDGLAFIGRDPTDAPGVYVVTGDSGMGMTHGTIAGLLLADLIQGRPNPWTGLYDPGRVPLKSSGTLISENVNAVTRYARWFTGGDVGEVGEIAPGSGAVVRRGMKKVAVYRESDGSLVELSAVCPHLGCIVGWNAVEKSWDCPCHGSRFDPHGRVLNGPAISDLRPADPEVSPRNKEV